MKRILGAVLLAAIVSVSCGPEAASYGSAAAISDALGCSDLNTSTAKLVDEAATCSLGGERVAIFTFTDEAERDEWLGFGERFADDLIVGPAWAVDPPDAQAEEVEEALS